MIKILCHFCPFFVLLYLSLPSVSFCQVGLFALGGGAEFADGACEGVEVEVGGCFFVGEERGVESEHYAVLCHFVLTVKQCLAIVGHFHVG